MLPFKAHWLCLTHKLVYTLTKRESLQYRPECPVKESLVQEHLLQYQVRRTSVCGSGHTSEQAFGNYMFLSYLIYIKYQMFWLHVYWMIGCMLQSDPSTSFNDMCFSKELMNFDFTCWNMRGLIVWEEPIVEVVVSVETCLMHSKNSGLQLGL